MRTALALLAAFVLTTAGCATDTVVTDDRPVAGAAPQQGPATAEPAADGTAVDPAAFVPVDGTVAPVTAPTPAPIPTIASSTETFAPVLYDPLPLNPVDGSQLVLGDHPSGKFGCEGAPMLAIWRLADHAEAPALATDHRIQTGGLQLVEGAGSTIAWTEFCDGVSAGIFSAALTTDGSVTNVRPVPIGVPSLHGRRDVIARSVVDDRLIVEVFHGTTEPEIREVDLVSGATLGGTTPAGACSPWQSTIFAATSEPGVGPDENPIGAVRVAVCRSADGYVEYHGVDLTTGNQIRLPACQTVPQNWEATDRGWTYRVVDERESARAIPGVVTRTAPDGGRSTWQLWSDVERDVAGQSAPAIC